jgi:hypothetical protein
VTASSQRPAQTVQNEHASKTNQVAIISTIIVFTLLLTFLVWLAFNDFNRPGSALRVVAAALGLIGVVTVQAIALMGLLLKRSVDERTLSIGRAAEARLTLDSERNAALARETEQRMRIDSARNLALQREDRAVSRVKTVRDFFEFLSSPDVRKKEAALVLIGELGDHKLAIRLSKIYEAEGGMDALATLTQSVNPELAQDAVDAWRDVTNHLRRSVARISVVDDNGLKTVLSGYCLLSPKFIVTVGASGLSGLPVNAEIVTGATDSDRDDNVIDSVLVTSRATLVVHAPEFTLFRLESENTQLQPLDIGSTSTLRVGDPLYILSFMLGALDATQSRGRFMQQVDGELIVSGFQTAGGSSGAPVVDGSGRLVGMHYKRRDDTLTYAVSVETIARAIRREVPNITDPVP